MYVCIRVYVCVCMYVCVCVCIYIYIYIYMIDVECRLAHYALSSIQNLCEMLLRLVIRHTSYFTTLYKYAFNIMYVCMHLFVCMYVYTYTHTHTYS
jgi:hypothetical protein